LRPRSVLRPCLLAAAGGMKTTTLYWNVKFPDYVSKTATRILAERIACFTPSLLVSPTKKTVVPEEQSSVAMRGGRRGPIEH
jgi:hypothetical protein